MSDIFPSFKVKFIPRAIPITNVTPIKSPAPLKKQSMPFFSPSLNINIKIIARIKNTAVICSNHQSQTNIPTIIKINATMNKIKDIFCFIVNTFLFDSNNFSSICTSNFWSSFFSSNISFLVFISLFVFLFDSFSFFFKNSSSLFSLFFIYNFSISSFMP